MKRFLVFLGAALISISCSIGSVFAADTNIVLTSAQPDAEKSFVNVEGSITGVDENQQITYMIAEIKDGEYDPDNICYINQTVYTNADGNFSFKLGVKGALEADKVYVVRIGGSNVKEPVALIVGTNESGGVKFIIGDVDGDNVITYNDASVALQYILDPNSVDSKITSDENFMKKINVTGGAITAKQVSYILAKALNTSFEFPKEEQAAKQ